MQNQSNKMQAVFVIGKFSSTIVVQHLHQSQSSTALLALAEAVEYAKPEQQLPEPIEVPEHIKTLITNHINHVLQQKPQGHQSTLVLTGHVPQPGQVQDQGQVQGKAAGVVVVPHLDLLPPHKQPQVINHQVTASHGPHIVLALPGQLPVDIGDKVNKLQQHVAHVMQQAEQHIPNAINQAIKEHKKQQNEKQKQEEEKKKEQKQQEEKQKEEKLRHKVEEQQEEQQETQQSGRLLLSAVQVPELLEKQRGLQQLGKCNFACPQKALPVCASNGKCTVEFPGQCELSQWNCFNTKNGELPPRGVS